MKNLIIKVRTFLLEHFKNKYIRKFVEVLVNYEMISYIFFGVGTSVLDLVIFSALNFAGMDSLIANLISSVCAIIFAYVTNKMWVFESKTNGFNETVLEFLRFAYARAATLVMSEIIILISQLMYGNDKVANQIAKIIAMVLTVIFNYIFSKLFIFNRKGTKNENQ